jgi:hypothetical protein
MPHAAIRTGDVDLVLPLHDIASALVRLASDDGPEAGGQLAERMRKRRDGVPSRRQHATAAPDIP